MLVGPMAPNARGADARRHAARGESWQFAAWSASVAKVYDAATREPLTGWCPRTAKDRQAAPEQRETLCRKETVPSLYVRIYECYSVFFGCSICIVPGNLSICECISFMTCPRAWGIYKILDTEIPSPRLAS